MGVIEDVLVGAIEDVLVGAVEALLAVAEAFDVACDEPQQAPICRNSIYYES